MADKKWEVKNGVLILIGNPASIKDNIEAVVIWCIKNLQVKDGSPIIYQVEDKTWDNIIHDGVKFLRFEKLKTIFKEDAVLLVQDPDQDSGGDFWNFHKLKDQERRATNRETGPAELTEVGIEFISKNHGAHLIIGKPAVVNFWPGTQRWTATHNKHMNGRGTKGLIDWIRKHHPSLIKGESNGPIQS